MMTETTMDETRSDTGGFVDITGEVDELLSRPDVAETVEHYTAERRQVDRDYAVTLAGLRNAFNLTQVELAREMGVSQSAIAKMEHQGDMLLSTLRSYVGAMHRQIRLVVKLDDGSEVEVDLTRDKVPEGQPG
jgi:DNA-binding XRE family transcriptional regulator